MRKVPFSLRSHGLGKALGLALAAAAGAGAQGANCQAGSGPFDPPGDPLAVAAAATPHVCAYNAEVNAAAGTKIRHVLLYDWSAGGHSRTHTQKHMYRLSRRYGFRLDRSQQQDYITPATLQGVDIVVFNNGDQDPLQNQTSLTAMRNFIEAEGKSMLAIHAALAFIPCPNEDVTVADLTTCRWFLRAYRTQMWHALQHNSANSARIYADSVLPGEVPPNALGADIVPASQPHGRRNPQTRRIFEELPLNGPSGMLANRPYIWEGLWDEWYAYRNHPRRAPVGTFAGIDYGPVNILLSLDESSLSGSTGCSLSSGTCKVGDRPVSWTRRVGLGLAAYNNAGHGDVYVRFRTVSGDTVNDSLMEKYNWRLMKYLARDFVGCMEPSDANYNPQATVLALTPSDPACPCQTSTNCFPVGVRWTTGGASPALGGFTVRAGVLRVTLPEPGPHRVRVTDAAGREVRATPARGGGNPVAITGLRPGVYLVTVDGPDGATRSGRVRIPPL